MSVFSTGYCKITGLSKAMPEAHYIPMMPALSQNEQSQLFGCKITMAAHMDHHYVPIIEYGKGKGPGVMTCKITGIKVESVARPVPLPEEGTEVKRAHRFKQDLRYMEPHITRLANEGEKTAMEELLERMRKSTELDPAHYFVYTLHDRRTGKTGMVLPYEYEAAIHSGAIESILLSGDSNSLVVRIKDGPMCTIPMDKVGKMQIERLSQDEMLFDGHGPDREIIEEQRRDRAMREKEDRDQMAQYLAEMERKRKERELRKKEKMKDTMKRKMVEAEEAERRQKALDEEIKRQYEDAARIRDEAEAAKAAAREAATARASERDRKEAEARAKRAEELARLAEEQLRREEEERRAAEEARRAEEAAAAEALAAVDAHDMSVNELLDHMREQAGSDEALIKDMEEAASIGMSSQQVADMFSTSIVEAIDEQFAESEEEEEEEDESEEEEEEEEEDAMVQIAKDEPDLESEPGMSEEEIRAREEERRLEEEALKALREEMLEKKRIEREAKREERQRKREEQERKEEEKRLAKEARELKKKEMYERMAAVRRADAAEEEESMKKPEKREYKPHEIQRRKPRPAPIQVPVEDAEDPSSAEFVVQTQEGVTVITEEDLNETSVIEGRISSDKETGEAKLTPGRAIKTDSGVEFVAGRIVTTDEGQEFMPGEAVELPTGPKFVPGQTIATRNGSQFVAGKTIGEGENIEFVPGHVVNLGEKMGEVFVPGQVMETDEGPKFIPGSVYRCRRAGPLFVPGQLRDGQFIPGKIIETEDGPRFMSPKIHGREEQFTFAVQSFDLHPNELELVKLQYRSPEPSPVFQGQDIGESLNLLQMAARGYKAKTLPTPEPSQPPPKSKRQIYENVRVTFLDCIDIAERARNAAPQKALGKESLKQEARRTQRVLADDLNHPMPLADVTAFLRKCLSLPTPTLDISIWIDGFFGHSEQGVFRPLEPMLERKLSRKVSLQKTLVDVMRESENELQEARRRDIVLENLARVLKRPPPRRSHVEDYRERWQERISGILLTSGKEVLNDVFNTVAFTDDVCVKTVLNDIKDLVQDMSTDLKAVNVLEHSICNYVKTKMESRLEDLLGCEDHENASRRDGLTQKLLLNEAIGLSLLEDEGCVTRCLKQCLATPALVEILPLFHSAMEMLRTVLHLHSLSASDERRQGLLGNLARNPGVLCDNGQWVKLVSGAKVITQHVRQPRRSLRSAGCITDRVATLLTATPSPELDDVIHWILLDASRSVHGRRPESQLPVMVVKNQYDGILPRDTARDVINGKIEYLLVNEEGVELVRVGEVGGRRRGHAKVKEDMTRTEEGCNEDRKKNATPKEDQNVTTAESPAISSRKPSSVAPIIEDVDLESDLHKDSFAVDSVYDEQMRCSDDSEIQEEIEKGMSEALECTTTDEEKAASVMIDSTPKPLAEDPTTQERTDTDGSDVKGKQIYSQGEDIIEHGNDVGEEEDVSAEATGRVVASSEPFEVILQRQESLSSTDS